MKERLCGLTSAFSKIAIAASALTLIQAAPVFAQTHGAAGANSPTTEEGISQIVVTARRVEERLQDVPISMTVFNQQQLSDRNVSFASDLATYTPSLSIDNQFGYNNTVFALRGFSQALQTQPTVGVFFADVVAPRGGPIARSGDGAGPGDLFDLQNVQVLKGPQGTLFGRNTTGGDVLLVPRKPTSETNGYVEVSGGNYGMERVQGVFNTPLNDVVRIRLGFDQQTRDGYLKNASAPGPSNFNDVDYFALRGSVVVDITPNLENYTIATFARSRTNGPQSQMFACNPKGIFGLGGFVPELLTTCTQQLAQQNATGNAYAVSNNLADAGDSLREWRIINTTTWKATDNLTIKNITGYAQLNSTLLTGLFGDHFTSPASTGSLPFPFALVANPPGGNLADQKTFTEELQFQGHADDDRLQWQAGGYLELSDPLAVSRGDSQNYIACSNLFGHQCTDVLGAALSQAFGYPVGAIQFGSSEDKSATIRYRDYAGYAQTTYALNSQLKLTGGVRYSSDHSTGDSTDVLYAYPAANTPVASCKIAGQNLADNCPNEVSQSSAKPTWMLDAEYAPVSDVMAYVKYSRGYRAGNVNGTGVPLSLQTFKPESVNVYELGAKTGFKWPIPGTFNFATFYNDFTNQQLLESFAPVGLGSYTSGIVNGGKSKILGAELEATASPVEGLTLDLAYTYLDSKLISQTPTNAPGFNVIYGANPGDPLPYTPKHKGSFSANYTLPLGRSIGNIVLGANYVHTSTAFVTEGSPYGTLPAYGLLNFNVDWNAIAGRPVDVSFFINNATNKLWETVVPGLYSAVGFESRNLGEPRMFGARLRVRF
jgi:iron complex outermembrane receptor protein